MSATLMDMNPQPTASPDSTQISPDVQTPPDSSIAQNASDGSPFAIVTPADRIFAVVRLLVYLAIAWLVYEMAVGVVRHFRPHPAPLWWDAIIESVRILAVIVPALLMARIEKQPFGVLGLPARGALGKNIWIGAAWGI